MSGKHPDGKNAPQAQRLRRLRKALGFESSVKFAISLGITSTRWNNFETGHPLSRDVANMIVGKYRGIDLDYLESGHTDGLSSAMLRKLREAEIEPPPPTRRGTKKRPERR